VERRKNLVGTVIRPALREGEIIYVRGRWDAQTSLQRNATKVR
jgi:hypothetical protein